MEQRARWKILEVSGLAFILLFGHYFIFGYLGGTGLSVNLRLFGMGAYTLYYLTRRIRRNQWHIFRGDSRLFLVFMGVLLFWFVYGMAGVFISSYTTLTGGLRAMYNLVLNICTVFCVYECCHSRQMVTRLLDALRGCCLFLIVFAFAESFIGFRLPGTEMIDPGLINGVPAGLHMPELFVSHGFDINCNNLSTRIAILLPTLFLTGGESRMCVAWRFFMICLGLFVMIVNGANLTIISLFAALIVHCVLCRQSWKANVLTVSGTGVLILGGAAYVTDGLVAIKKHFWPPLPGKTVPIIKEPLVTEPVPSGPVELQMSKGSVSIRMDIYRDLWDMAVDTHFLGVGPDGVSWLDVHGARTDYRSPHCWYLEVLSQ